MNGIKIGDGSLLNDMCILDAPELPEIERQVALKREKFRTILASDLKKRRLSVEQMPGAEFLDFPVAFYNACVMLHINELEQLQACCKDDFFPPDNQTGKFPSLTQNIWKRAIKILHDQYGISISKSLNEIDPRKLPLRPIAASQNTKLARVADVSIGLLTFADLMRIIKVDPQFFKDWLVDNPLNGQDGQEMFQLVIEELQRFQMLSTRAKATKLLEKKRK